MDNQDINLQIQTLPAAAGVYQFYDLEGNYLYVGKAKNLKKRVSSYFQKNHSSNKLRIMVRQINNIRHIVVQSESDALLLENSLIKTHQPKYNILLKDDKTYPWICIKKERYPRVFYTRRMIKDGSEYYGPYTNVHMIRTILDMVRQLYPLRSCKYDLSEKNITQGKYKRCLEYHLKNCKAPCEDLQSEEEYMQDIQSVRKIIKGDIRGCLQQLHLEMQHASDELQYEEAQLVKDKITALENYQSKSTIVNPKMGQVDVFSIISDESYAYVNFLQISNGTIIRSHTTEMKKKLDEDDQHLLEFAVLDIRQRFDSTSQSLIVPFFVSTQSGLQLTIPKAGDKRRLLDLSIRNARFYKQDRLKQVRIIDPERHSHRILNQMKADLRLPNLPQHIECFDNSNLQGTNPVAACVVFINAKPNKKQYRHYNIKTVEGPDDFASMEEVVYRRYRRLLEEEQTLPQLIVIDGGKGQLSSAMSALDRLHLRGKIAVIGIAKRLEEIFYPGDSIPLYLDKTSETLKIIQQLRNEAHRFGIDFHRNKRSHQALCSEIEQIEGIGEKTAVKLMKQLKSVKRIRDSKLNTLENIVGKRKAIIIVNHFKKDA